MSLATPEKHWWQPLDKNESTWVWVCVVVALFFFLMMPFYHLWGKQNPPQTSYKVTPMQYKELHDNFVDANQKKDAEGNGIDISGIPVVKPGEGVKDVYLLAAKWLFSPVLELEKGKEYRLHMSSLDLNHGFSLQPKNLNFQIVPGYDLVVTITPRESGEFYILCNEYCEIGHHTMIGKMIVTE